MTTKKKQWGQQQLTLWQQRQRHLVHEWVRHAKCTWSIWIYVHCTRNKKLTLWANQKVYFVHWTEYVLVLWCGPLYEKMQNTKSMILLNVLHTEQIRYLLRDVVVGCRWPAEGILEPPLLVISYCNIIKIKIKAPFNTMLYICIWCTRSSNFAPNVEVSPKKYTSPLLEASS